MTSDRSDFIQDTPEYQTLVRSVSVGVRAACGMN